MKALLKQHAPHYFYTVIAFGFLHTFFTEGCDTSSVLHFFIGIKNYIVYMVGGLHMWTWGHSASTLSGLQVFFIYLILIVINIVVIQIKLTSDDVHDYIGECLSVLWGLLIVHICLAFMLTSSTSEDKLISFFRVLFCNPLGVFATAFYVLLRLQYYPYTDRKIYLDYALAGFVTGFVFTMLLGFSDPSPLFNTLENTILVKALYLAIGLATWVLIKTRLDNLLYKAKDFLL